MGGQIRKIFRFIFLFFFCFTLSDLFASQEIPKVVVLDNRIPASTGMTVSDHSQKSLLSFISKKTEKIISQQTIQQSGAHSIKEILQAQMGIQVQDLYGDGSENTISMRGFGDNASGNTAILINGHPLVNPDLGKLDIASIPVSEIKQIKILPGSSGVLYGDQAVGGVVNIITGKVQKKFRKISAQFGSYNTKILQAELSDGFKNGVGYQFGAHYDTTSNYRWHNDRERKGVNGLITYSFGKGKAYLRLNHFDRNLQYPGC